jgi:hypothetical protein
MSKTGLFILVLMLGAFLGAQSAQATPIVLDFRTGTAGFGGTITPNGTNATGSGILIDFLSVVGAPVSGGFNVDGPGPATVGSTGTTATLNFNTATNTISITGRVPGLGMGTDVALLNGTFSTFSVSNNGTVVFFNGTGTDVKDASLLAALGLPTTMHFNYVAFSIAAKLVGTDFVAFSTTVTNRSVPEPTSALLIVISAVVFAAILKQRVQLPVRR